MLKSKSKDLPAHVQEHHYCNQRELIHKLSPLLKSRKFTLADFTDACGTPASTVNAALLASRPFKSLCPVLDTVNLEEIRSISVASSFSVAEILANRGDSFAEAVCHYAPAGRDAESGCLLYPDDIHKHFRESVMSDPISSLTSPKQEGWSDISIRARTFVFAVKNELDYLRNEHHLKSFDKLEEFIESDEDLRSDHKISLKFGSPIRVISQIINDSPAMVLRSSGILQPDDFANPLDENLAKNFLNCAAPDWLPENISKRWPSSKDVETMPPGLRVASYRMLDVIKSLSS